MEKQRDLYIDFLRAFGLIMLVVVHTRAPEWLAAFRSFDVPLMVFISALCYTNRGGYGAYLVKRLKRIYIPVLVFLTLWLALMNGALIAIGHPPMEFPTIIGSYLLLNQPSIGYVWIMRVFLMMAILSPLYFKWLKNVKFIGLIVVLAIITIMQTYLVAGVQSIQSYFPHLIADQFLLYAVGYSLFVVMGIKYKGLSQKQLLILTLMFAISVVGFILYNHLDYFKPSEFKYPPEKLYLLYGAFACTLLWYVKPLFAKVKWPKWVEYLSTNSMWIYLWHIIPVSFIEAMSKFLPYWGERFIVTLAIAVTLNIIYHKAIRYLPQKIEKLIA